MLKVITLVFLGSSLAAAFEYQQPHQDYYQPNGFGGAYERPDEKRDFFRNLIGDVIYVLIKIGDEVPPHYAFEYKVHDPHTGDIKSQGEQRQGDVVKGYYTLRDADGSLREVHYAADPHRGFHAEVKRTGHGHHPHYGHEGSYAY